MKKTIKYILCLLLATTLMGCDLGKDIIVPKEDPEQPVEPVEPVIPEEPEEPEIYVDYCASDANACPDYSSYTPGASYESIAEAYAHTVKSVVTVLSYVGPDMIIATGSGVIYATSMDNQYVYLYTNAHVISGHLAVGAHTKIAFYEVIYYNNTRVKAELLAKSLDEDIAILRAEIEPDNDYEEAVIGDESYLSVGDTIYTIGTPFSIDYRNTLTAGVVSGLNVLLEADNDNDGLTTKMYLIQIDAALSSGNSGGPLFNMAGEVVGINTLKILNSTSNVVESMNYSLRMSHFGKVANAVLKDGVYSRPLIGVNVFTIGDCSLSYREEKGLSPLIKTGLLIDSIPEDGASFGKLEKDQVITAINHKPCYTFADFVVELLKYESGEVVIVSVVNKDNTNAKDVEITLK